LTSKTKDDEGECLVRSVIKWRKFISKRRIPHALLLSPPRFSPSFPGASAVFLLLGERERQKRSSKEKEKGGESDRERERDFEILDTEFFPRFHHE
jgi:hypothetical protein